LLNLIHLLLLLLLLLLPLLCCLLILHLLLLLLLLLLVFLHQVIHRLGRSWLCRPLPLVWQVQCEPQLNQAGPASSSCEDIGEEAAGGPTFGLHLQACAAAKGRARLGQHPGQLRGSVQTLECKRDACAGLQNPGRRLGAGWSVGEEDVTQVLLLATGPTGVAAAVFGPVST
jgi:hypothetical protein